MPEIVPVYAGLLGLIFVYLSIRVIRTRRQEQVALGDDDNPRLRRAMRVHANFAEYVPLALILIAFAELQGQPAALIHGLGAALLVGRLVHAFGVSQEAEFYRFRTIGMWLTFITIVAASLMNLSWAAAQWF